MRIFLSYAKYDGKPIAERVRVRLAAISGVTVWMDTSLDSGTVWSKTIEREIDACDVFVVILTPDVNRPEDSRFGASFVLNEINHAQSQHKLLIPLMAIPNVRLPIQIAQLQYLDIIGGNFDQGMAHLTARLLKLATSSTPLTPLQPTAPPPPRSPNRWLVLGGLLIAVVVLGLFIVPRLNTTSLPTMTVIPATLEVTATLTNPVTPSAMFTSTPTVSPTPAPTETLIPTQTPASFQTGALHQITVRNVVLFQEDPSVEIMGSTLLPVARDSIIRIAGALVSDGNRNYFPVQIVGSGTAGWIAQDSIGPFVTPTRPPQINTNEPPSLVATTVSRTPVLSTCGNLICENGENYRACPFDCPTPVSPVPPTPVPPMCGNSTCQSGENYQTCPIDCASPVPPTPIPPTCGNLVCQSGENYLTCPFDCPTPAPR